MTLADFDFLAPKDFKIRLVWLSNILDLRVPDEDYSRNASHALSLISTFLLNLHDLGDGRKDCRLVMMYKTTQK